MDNVDNEYKNNQKYGRYKNGSMWLKTEAAMN